MKAVKTDRKGVCHSITSATPAIARSFRTTSDECRITNLEPPVCFIEQMNTTPPAYVGIMPTPLDGKPHKLTKEDVGAHCS